MMNWKKYLPIAFILSVVLVACGSNAYKTAMDLGIAAVQDRDFEKALAHFEEAFDQASDIDESLTAIGQTEVMIEAKEALEEDGIDRAFYYYEEVVEKENGIEEITEIAQKLMDEITFVDEQLVEIEVLQWEGSYEEAYNTLKKLKNVEVDEIILETVTAEYDKFEQELKTAILFSKIEGYAQKDDEMPQFCQIKQDKILCTVLTIDTSAYREIVAIHLEDDDSLRIETNRKDKPDLVFSNITEKSFELNEEKYNVVAEDELQDIITGIVGFDYKVRDVFNEESIRDIEAFHSNMDYFQMNSDKKAEGGVGVEAVLSTYSDEEIEFARVWLDYYKQFEAEPPYPALTVQFWEKGRAISIPFEEDSAVFKEDVVALTGNFTADGLVVYSSNGDGTINLYDIPTHWPGEYEMEGGVKAYTTKIANSPKKIKISDGEIIEVLDVLETMSVYR